MVVIIVVVVVVVVVDIVDLSAYACRVVSVNVLKTNVFIQELFPFN